MYISYRSWGRHGVVKTICNKTPAYKTPQFPTPAYSVSQGSCLITRFLKNLAANGDMMKLYLVLGMLSAVLVFVKADDFVQISPQSQKLKLFRPLILKKMHEKFPREKIDIDFDNKSGRTYAWEKVTETGVEYHFEFWESPEGRQCVTYLYLNNDGRIGFVKQGSEAIDCNIE